MMRLEVKRPCAVYLLISTLVFLALTQLLSVSTGKLFYFNFTSSADKGIYIKAKSQNLEKGDLVVFSVPAGYKNKFIGYDKKLLKRVYGTEGDNYCITGSGIIANKLRLKSKKTDFSGEVLPKRLGCRVISPGNFLPLSLKSLDSFDGRYFGEVSVIGSTKVKSFFTF